MSAEKVTVKRYKGFVAVHIGNNIISMRTSFTSNLIASLLQKN